VVWGRVVEVVEECEITDKDERTVQQAIALPNRNVLCNAFTQESAYLRDG